MVTKTEIVVRYAETDQMGIAHHSNYAVWYEQARTEFIRHFGLSYGEMEKLGVWLPLLELNCRYGMPARYEERLVVETRIGLLTPSRIRFDYTIRKEGEEKPINQGFTQHAFTTPALRPMNLKKKFPELYQLLSDAAESSN